MFVYITRNNNNSLGAGWKISTDNARPQYYYGYTKAGALKKWREDMGLKGQKLDILEY